MNVKQHIDGRLRRYRRSALIAASAAMMALAALAGGSAARAATSVPLHAASATSQVAASRSAAPDYIRGLVTFESQHSARYYEQLCSVKTASISPPAYAENGCGTRVWLYEYINRRGYDLCLDPDSNTGQLRQSYKSYWVSSNELYCP